MSDGSNKQLTDVLLNIFLINKKRYHVLLHNNEIVCEKENSNKEKNIITVQDIITVNLKCCKNSRRNFPNIFTNRSNQVKLPVNNDNNDHNHIDNDHVTTQNDDNHQAALIIYYAKRLKNSRKHYNQWRKKTITLYNNDISIIKKWHETLADAIKLQKRPKHILVFINPFGGKKQAIHLYEKYTKPLMNLANIEINCIISQRHNQIHDIIMSHQLDLYDAICCVGGDGTFAEVFNGLLFRTIKDLNMDLYHPDFIPRPKIPIGIIPAGSTNTVAYCMHGTTDIRTAVIHIILGQTRGLDLSSFCNSNGLVKFYASVMSYGYLGDVAKQSENFRWMGPKRYDYTGFKKLLLNNGYESEITYLLTRNNDNDDKKENLAKIECYVDCVRCMNAKNSISDNEINITPFNSDKTIRDSQRDFQNQSSVPTEKYIDNNEWKSIKGKFFMISSANIRCSSSRSLNGLSPYCHLGDGYIDIVLVRHTNLLNNIRLLLTLVNRNKDIANLPFVEIYRTRKFLFRAENVNDVSLHGSCQPIANLKSNYKTSQWNCDGEVINDAELSFSSHCQLINVFMRGPHEANVGNSTNCFSI